MKIWNGMKYLKFKFDISNATSMYSTHNNLSFNINILNKLNNILSKAYWARKYSSKFIKRCLIKNIIHFKQDI